MLQMRLWLCVTAFYQHAGVLLCGEMSHRLKEVIDSAVVIGAKFTTCLQNLEREYYMECLSNKNKEKQHASQTRRIIPTNARSS